MMFSSSYKKMSSFLVDVLHRPSDSDLSTLGLAAVQECHNDYDCKV